MESEAAMKITASYEVMEIALSNLSHTLSDVSLDGMPVKGKNTIVSLLWACEAIKKVLADEPHEMSDNVQKVKKLYDAEDEQSIEEIVIKIEKLLYGIGEVHKLQIPNQPALDAIANTLPLEDETGKGKISSNPYSMENIARVCRGKEPIIK